MRSVCMCCVCVSIDGWPVILSRWKESVFERKYFLVASSWPQPLNSRFGLIDGSVYPSNCIESWLFLFYLLLLLPRSGVRYGKKKKWSKDWNGRIGDWMGSSNGGWRIIGLLLLCLYQSSRCFWLLLRKPCRLTIWLLNWLSRNNQNHKRAMNRLDHFFCQHIPPCHPVTTFHFYTQQRLLLVMFALLNSTIRGEDSKWWSECISPEKNKVHMCQ